MVDFRLKSLGSIFLSLLHGNMLKWWITKNSNVYDTKYWYK